MITIKDILKLDLNEDIKTLLTLKINQKMKYNQNWNLTSSLMD
jgi:hypothetical protein